MLVAVILGLAGWLLFRSRSALDPEQALDAARAALSAEDFSRAIERAEQAAADPRLASSACEIAGEAAFKAHRYDDAVAWYLRLADRQAQAGEPPYGWYFAGEVWRAAGRLNEACSLYRRFVTVAPANPAVRERLGFLLSAAGHRWDAVPHFAVLVQGGGARFEELALFADPERPVEQRPYLERAAKQAPRDFLVRVGLAAHDVWEGQIPDARTSLEELAREYPESAVVRALLGETLVAEPDERLLAWYHDLQPDHFRNPDLHYLCGLHSRRRGDAKMAARCFWEAIRLAPLHRRATFQLGQALRVLEHPAATAVEARGRDLAHLTQWLDEALATRGNAERPWQEITATLERLGRIWEAGAWGVLARERFPAAEWPSILLARVAPQLRPDLPLVVIDRDPGRALDLSSWPDFAPAAVPQRAVEAASGEEPPQATIRFDDSSNVIDFVYHNGADPATPGARLFEQTGGGAVVIDYDRDGRPDLFFPQGGNWPTGRTEPDPPGEFIDRLFRNGLPARPVDVTSHALPSDRGFGQGAASGDFNNDGFPDLYIANVGRNQLLLNNGDGTFGDITMISGLGESDWTASCAIADLNSDGYPDLFDVNYLTGPGVYERICGGKSCSPDAFPGVPDRLWIAQGDGRFSLVPPPAPEVDGKGLGLIVFREAGRSLPSLFIANDQVPNFLLRNEPASGEGAIRWRDEAFVGGVAFNQDGLAMASMGIAADDADGDGRLDFYVSTFKDESSMLLIQDADGQFVDRANPAGLWTATWPYVGWGTQFLDADRDGAVDLVGVNGHVDDYRDQGGDYQMRSLFFHNRGHGRFAVPPDESLGPFFAKKRLGRGLARLDWDGDGLMDFAVSNIGDVASLVLNRTSGAGHWISVRLVATMGERDAFGTEVEVVSGTDRRVRQLVAGDGYMASNERLLQTGLGAGGGPVAVRIRWTSGRVDEVVDVPVDGVLEVVEGRGAAIWCGDGNRLRSLRVNGGDPPLDRR